MANSESNSKNTVIDITNEGHKEQSSATLQQNTSSKSTSKPPSNTQAPDTLISSGTGTVSKSGKPSNGKVMKDVPAKPASSSPTKRSGVSNGDILSYMEEFQATFICQANAINKKIDAKIDEMQSDLISKINTLASSVDDRINDVRNNIKAQIAPAVENLVLPITTALESRIDKLERESLLLDLVVTGIPLHKNEKINDLVHRIFTVIGFKQGLTVLSGYYRLSSVHKHSTNSKNAMTFPPIILKFWSFEAKQDFFKLYMVKRSLSLSDLGFKSTARVYINDSLTSSNQKILIKARILQKNKIIHHCHTYRGQVYIRVHETSSNQCVSSMDELLHLENGAQNSTANN